MELTETPTRSMDAPPSNSPGAYRVAGALAGLVVVGAAVSLLGWILNIPRLTDWEGHGITIKGNAALCLVALSVALLLAVALPKARAIINLLAGTAAVIAVATLFEHASGVNLGIDTLLFSEAPGALATSAPGRMGIPGSSSIAMLGIAVMLYSSGGIGRRNASALGVGVLAITSISLAGYLYGATQLYSIGKLTGIALQTAAMLSVLGLAVVIAVPEAGIAGAIRRRDAGGQVLRRLIGPVIVIPVILGWLRVHGETAKMYDSAFGSSMRTVLEMLLLLGLLWWASAGISRATEEVKGAETALRNRDAQLRTVVDSLQEGVVIADPTGFLVDWNAAALRMHLLSPEEGLCGFQDLAKQFKMTDLEGRDLPLEDWPVPRLLRGESFSAWDLCVKRLDREFDRVFSFSGAPVYEGDEVVLVVVTMQDVTNRIHAAKELRESHSTLERKVAERTAELLATNEQLQGFTYSVAHDLRQQIRGISANASMLMLDAGDSLDEDNKATLGRMVNSAKKLATLVDELLTYAKIGKQQINYMSVDLSALAEEVAGYLIEQGRCRQGTRFRIEPGLIGRGDPSMLRLALENLLDNAAKYSSKEELPLIEFGREDDAFFVRDNGIGFDMKFSHKLFEPFERLHRDTEFSGTGIGLANVKRIVSKHGGRVWAKGELGKGATFYFMLGNADGTEVE